MSNVSKAYEIAKEVYAGIGVDTDQALEKLKKSLDKGDKMLYYNPALRRQQVAFAVIPAEDINNILIVFVSLRLYDAGAFFMSVQSFVWR